MSSDSYRQSIIQSVCILVIFRLFNQSVSLSFSYSVSQSRQIGKERSFVKGLSLLALRHLLGTLLIEIKSTQIKSNVDFEETVL